MNDLATYRIFVTWLWTVVQHEPAVTKDGWLKGPKLTEDGVIPADPVIQLKAGEIHQGAFPETLGTAQPVDQGIL